MKRYIRSDVKFHKYLSGFKADNGYAIESNGVIGGMHIYVVRDANGKVVQRVTSLADAKQIIRDIANEY